MSTSISAVDSQAEELELEIPDLSHRQWRKRRRKKLDRFVSSVLNLFKSSKQTAPESSSLADVSDADLSTEFIPELNIDVENSQSEETDFRWAVVYENQRGFMLFSIPHYSSRSLLPRDPPPFSTPEHPAAHIKNKKLRNLLRSAIFSSLDEYQFPDPKWRWVSEAWMIDMQWSKFLQHDGFQYNWLFRSKGWRSNPGILSTGGGVRRRRWVRLMMRPGISPHNRNDGDGNRVEISD